MKPRYAAALALVGWYLMYPPGATTTIHIRHGEVVRPFPRDAYAPLSQWTALGSFDSAADCDKARHKLSTTVRPNAPENSAQYVASDDPRFKER